MYLLKKVIEGMRAIFEGLFGKKQEQKKAENIKRDLIKEVIEKNRKSKTEDLPLNREQQVKEKKKSIGDKVVDEVIDNIVDNAKDEVVDKVIDTVFKKRGVRR